MNDPILVFAITGLILAPAILLADFLTKSQIGQRFARWLDIYEEDE